MPEDNNNKTGTTQSQEKDTGQGTAGEGQTPPKKNGQQENTQQQQQTQTEGETQQQTQTEEDTKVVSVSVQERINRMYARLQQERAKNKRLQTELGVKQAIRRDTTEDDDGVNKDDNTVVAPGLTEDDVERILANRDTEQRFQASEKAVLMRHPSALNEDGTFNMGDPFVREYIDMGRKNPGLAALENGPELAEAMVEKKLGISYKRGRTDEANNQQVSEQAYSGTSTINVPLTKTVKLSDEERVVAKKMGINEQEYSVHKATQGKGNKVVQKNWGPKR